MVGPRLAFIKCFAEADPARVLQRVARRATSIDLHVVDPRVTVNRCIHRLVLIRTGLELASECALRCVDSESQPFPVDIVSDSLETRREAARLR